MSFIGSMFNGSKGAGFDASGTPIVQPSTAAQATNDYAQSQQSLQQQQGLLAAIQAQNGIGNQSQVYNQLQGIANGTGPNPAQAQLNQNTANNIAQQASLMGSQRGVSANPGLIARQIALQGANTQQQAVGQAATLEAQQRMNAINAAGGIANSQVSNAINGANQYAQNSQANRGLTLQGIQGQNNANVGMQSNINSSNAGIAAGNAKSQQGLLGGITGAVGTAIPLLSGPGGSSLGPSPFSASDVGGGGPNGSTPMAGQGASMSNVAYKGGRVANKMAEGGPVSSFGRTYIGDNSSMLPNPNTPAPMAQSSSNNSDPMSGLMSMAPMLAMAAAHGGKVPVIVSPGEAYVPPKNVPAIAKGKASLAQAAERIPGKAKVKGDSLKNDTVPRELEEGGIVIPRTVMNSKNPEKKAAAFVRAHMTKNGSLPKKKDK